MKKNTIENSKVGLIVIAGTLFLLFSLYMIGKNQNLFGSTFNLRAVVKNVNGLVVGNNVRFMGMDVGTVKSIDMANDTSIYISMLINNKMKPFIKKNAITTIGTDGLMGNKLIHILPQKEVAEPVEEGDVIFSQTPIDTDDIFRSLNATSMIVEKTSLNLFEITSKLNGNENFWAFLSDTVLTQDLRNSVREFRRTGANASAMTLAGRNLVERLEQGSGLVNTLFMDSILSNQLTTSLEQIGQASTHAELLLEEVKTMVIAMEKGEGTTGLILRDSMMRESILNTALNIEEGTDKFNQNMEALKTNFLFRRYFRRQERLRAKEKEAGNGN
ncbi:MlaD family protein [Rhodonellum sp.]|uniref:MlaD family protein n=1 Tax=Rhodonellum sp. TaxID=2231180 RepID=UPI00271BEC1E|nr:MlaD family protein [Rhodonellum sp.]MDO9554633.1 MlaD family protein [Rhodonellum sp.]